MVVYESLGQKLWTLSYLSESSDVPAECSSNFEESPKFSDKSDCRDNIGTFPQLTRMAPIITDYFLRKFSDFI